MQRASGATHPILAEAVTQFQAGAYKELLPADGPVRTMVMGASNPMKEQQSQRVKNFMNYQLMDQMKEQAKAVGTDMIQDHINKVDLSKKPFVAIGDGGQEYTADSIIISTGAQARLLNLKSEQEYRGFGVSGCATCDGFFFKGKEVAVVGGGNAAVEEAQYVTTLS